MSHPIGIVYDKMSSQVEIQILKDLMLLSRQWDIKYVDEGQKLDPSLMAQAGLEASDDMPTMWLVYKTGASYPPVPVEFELGEAQTPVVYRDLEVKISEPRIDGTPRSGHYLKEQGRDGADLTDLYLNRQYPRGKGLSDAMIVYLWGN